MCHRTRWRGRISPLTRAPNMFRRWGAPLHPPPLNPGAVAAWATWTANMPFARTTPDIDARAAREALRAIGVALLSGGPASVARTAAYFAVLLGCLAGMLRTFPWALAARDHSTLLLAPAYGLGALVLTWRLILIFFVEHTRAHAADPDAPNVFVDAYVAVADDAAGWWWSQLLLGWVLVACPLAAREGGRLRVAPSALLLHVGTAFFGAVSLAFPFLLARLHIAHASAPPPRAAAARARLGPGAALWPACALAAAAGVATLPLSCVAHRFLFVGALVAVHVVLVVPFAADVIGPDASAAVRASPRAWARGYIGLGLMSFGLHAAATSAAATALRGPVAEAAAAPGVGVGAIALRLPIEAAHRNSCQFSIAIDAIGAAALGAAYIFSRAPRRSAVALCALAPIISPGAALAVLAASEERAHAHRAEKASRRTP